MSLKRYWTLREHLRESHGVSHHSTVVEVIIATEAQAEIDNLLTEKHETEIVVAGIVQERDQARAEIDRLRAALKEGIDLFESEPTDEAPGEEDAAWYKKYWEWRGRVDALREPT